MKRLRWGFTIVELLVILTVMGILIGLSVVALGNAQVESRDSERKIDVEAIALYLESFYSEGDSAIGPHYPSFITISEMIGEDGGIDPKVVRAPGVADDAPASLTGAGNAIETTSGVLPQPTINTYVYQPISSNNTALCFSTVDPCRRFNIYYMLEKDNTVHKVESRRQ